MWRSKIQSITIYLLKFGDRNWEYSFRYLSSPSIIHTWSYSCLNINKPMYPNYRHFKLESDMAENPPGTTRQAVFPRRAAHFPCRSNRRFLPSPETGDWKRLHLTKECLAVGEEERWPLLPLHCMVALSSHVHSRTQETCPQPFTHGLYSPHCFGLENRSA